MMRPTRQRRDAVMALPDNPDKPLWWWCDALFMAPPVLAKLSRATGDRKYLDFMDRQWWITSDLLYSPSNHLFFRDKTFLDKHEANGSSIFWSRGNGWVFAGAGASAGRDAAGLSFTSKVRGPIQGDGRGNRRAARHRRAVASWSAGCGSVSSARELRLSLFYIRLCLWDQHRHPGSHEISARGPESLGGLLSHIYQDGRLGCIQPIGASPSGYCCRLKLRFRDRRFSARGLRGLSPGALNLSQ